MKTELVIFDTTENSKLGTKKGFIALISIIILDLIWFKFSMKKYRKEVPSITNSIRYIPSVIAWFLVACALSVQNPKSLKEAIAYGSLVGLVIYGIYNATNYAIFKNWTINVSIMDTIWGIVVCSIVSIILYKIFGKYK
jgi:uncharacterized membrane protein